MDTLAVFGLQTAIKLRRMVSARLVALARRPAVPHTTITSLGNAMSESPGVTVSR